MVTQFGGEVFKTVPLELDLWLKIIAYTFSVVVFNELLKFILFVVRALVNGGRNKPELSSTES